MQDDVMDAAALLARFRQSYRDLELFPLITAEQIEAFRVDYGDRPLARLRQAVKAAPKNGKIIFAGHRGCGKSTLLAKFTRSMQQENYFVVFFSIAEMVEMSDVNHVNILYAIALMLLSKATKQQVPIPPQTQASLLDWLTTTQTQTVSRELKAEVGVGGDLFKMISAKLKSEDTFREEIKKTYERKISQLAAKTDEIAGYIQAATGKQVLVVIDDLDKLDLALVESIYRGNVKSLFLPNFQIIFTIPISVVRDVELVGTLQSEGISRIEQFAVAKFFPQEQAHDPTAEPIAQTVDVFLDVLGKRVPEELIEPEIAKQMVLHSGGVMRELVRIARECCTECMLVLDSEPDRTDVKIDQEILTAALRNLRNDFARGLGKNLYDLLTLTYENLTPPDAVSEDFLKLLHGLYVLEYLNDDLWYDVHPIVVDLLRRKKLIE